MNKNSFQTLSEGEEFSDALIKPTVMVNPYLTNQSKADTNELVEEIVGITNIAGNEFCFDCLASQVDYASFSFGILLCESCARLHRKDLHIEKS